MNFGVTKLAINLIGIFLKLLMKHKKIVVLGAGMVGSAIALDLSKTFNVTAADKRAENLTQLKKKGVTDGTWDREKQMPELQLKRV